jgi:hypothetical protein
MLSAIAFMNGLVHAAIFQRLASYYLTRNTIALEMKISSLMHSASLRGLFIS